MRVTKSRFVQVLNLIGLEGGANFLDQSHDEVKQNQSNQKFKNTLLHAECNSKDQNRVQ